MGPYLYVVGGSSKIANTALASVERAAIAGDGTLGEFAIVPGVTLSTARASMPLLALGGSLYAIGGGNTEPLATVERAAIDASGSLGTFSVMSGVSLPSPTEAPTAVVLGNSLHVVGGLTGTSSSRSVVRASIDGDGLLDTAVVGTSAYAYAGGRSYFTSAVVGNNFYAFGGYQPAGGLVSETAASIDQANIGADGTLGAFTSASASLAEPLRRLSAAVVGNYVYIIGGSNLTTPALTTVEQATIEPDGSLTSFVKLPNGLVTGRTSHAVAVAGNYLYAIGGFYDSNTGVERATINPDFSLGPFSQVSASLTTAHTECNTAVLGAYLYVLGGQAPTDVQTLTTIERVGLNYDGSLNGDFSATNAFAIPRTNPQLAVIGSYLYALGGDIYGSSVTVERALINSDGTLGTFAVVPGLSAPGPFSYAPTAGFLAGNTLTYATTAGGAELSLP
jgi:hypothetical protein